VRKLSVPTVIDRMIQQAMVQVMSPIFERVFSNDSFGFRSNRSAQDAINHDLVIKYIEQYTDDPCW
jgi:retron-type reverse transcriptase